MKILGAMSVPAQKKPPPGRLENRLPMYSNLRVVCIIQINCVCQLHAEARTCIGGGRATPAAQLAAAVCPKQ